MGHEVGVGEVVIAIRKGKPACFGHEVDRFDGIRRQHAKIEALQHTENLQQRDPTRSGRSHRAHARPPVVPADGLAADGAIGGKVCHRHAARVAFCGGDRPGDGFCNLAFIEGVRSLLGKQAKRFRERRIPQGRADGLGGAVRVQKIPRRWLEGIQMRRRRDHVVQAS